MKSSEYATLLCVAAFAMSAGSAEAVAQPAAERAAAAFANIDRDGDGFVDALEVVVSSHAKGSAAVLQADLDGDGKSTSLELLAAHARWAHALDRNRDGKVSREEFSAGGGPGGTGNASPGLTPADLIRMRDERLTAAFNAADKNGDGFWDSAELKEESRKHFDAFEEAIRNDKSGKLRHTVRARGKEATAEDYFSHHQILIRPADTNKDGKISVAEYMQWQKGMSK